MAITEGALTIRIPDGCNARRFDEGATHGLTHCMKAVDFIIETPASTIFLELKDPDAGTPERRSEWIEKLTSGIIDNNLKQKFRDTWIYLYASGKLFKPVYYFVIIGLTSLSTEALAQRSSSLRSQLPVRGPNGPWLNQLLADCSVHNIESWNRSFGEFEASRD